MRSLNPDVAAQWIEQDCSNREFRPVRDILSECLRGRIAKYSDEEIAEFAEQLAVAVTTALDRRISDYVRDGVVPAFEVSSDEGGAYFKALERPELGLLKDLRLMSPAAFEVFCKYILARMKADAVLEGGPHDGGVDFYAVGLSLGERTEPAPPTARVFVIGQSKRYAVTKDVAEVELRGFVGGAFRKAAELRGKYPDRFGLLTPLLLAFWTTSDFTPSAKKFAKDVGIWYLNGIGLAQFATRLGLGGAALISAEREAKQLTEQSRATVSAEDV